MEHTFLPLILASFWAFLIAIFAVPSIIRVAHIKNILDHPNLRTVHEELTPRLGGGAMFAGFMSALTIFTDLNNGVQQLLAACVLLFFIGLKDDLINISALKKFSMQLLATGVVMFMADIRITSFQGVLGVGELEIGISYAFTFLVIIGITNSINLIDGLDGLAGTLVIIAAATFGICFYLYGGSAYGNYAAVSFSLVGGVAGFLRYNFYKAKIFMGDTGSLLCGFILSVLAIQFIEMRSLPASPPLALSILFIPLFDTVRVLMIRILQGRSPFLADQKHIHHRLLSLGFSQIGTVLTLAAINTVVILVSFNLMGWSNANILWFLLVLSVALSVFLGVYKLKGAQSVSNI
jgi:UDP-GlcNAc:undecaprenyl-phosphate/decaprenyl-phosphate GlcNAc-1-phosphate transferase